MTEKPLIDLDADFAGALDEFERKFAELEAERWKDFGRELLSLWDNGNGDAHTANEHAQRMGPYMRLYEPVARDHVLAVATVAAGSAPVPAAHMILHDLYMRGWGIEADPAKALWHLRRAIDCGDRSALRHLGCYLLGEERLAPVLPADPPRGLDLLRQVSSDQEDVANAAIARKRAASYLIRNYVIDELCAEDLALIKRYAASGDIDAVDRDDLEQFCFWLGMDGRFNPIREDAHGATRTPCTDVPPQAPRAQSPLKLKPATTAQKAASVVKTIAIVSGIGLTLWVWTLIGTALLALAMMINALVVPIILGVLGIALIARLVRR